MKNALQRQLATSGWRLLGAALGLILLLGSAALWGNHIEHRIDNVAISQNRAIAHLRSRVNRDARESGQPESGNTVSGPARPEGGDADQSPHQGLQPPGPQPGGTEDAPPAPAPAQHPAGEVLGEVTDAVNEVVCSLPVGLCPPGP